MIRFTKILRSSVRRDEGLDLFECSDLAAWMAVSAVTIAADFAEVHPVESRPTEDRPTEDRPTNRLAQVWPNLTDTELTIRPTRRRDRGRDIDLETPSQGSQDGFRYHLSFRCPGLTGC